MSTWAAISLWHRWAINLVRGPPWEGRDQRRAVTFGNRNKSQFKLVGTNVCSVELEDILDLKIFVNASVGHCKHCGGPHLACRPLFAYPRLMGCTSDMLVRISFFWLAPGNNLLKDLLLFYLNWYRQQKTKQSKYHNKQQQIL